MQKVITENNRIEDKSNSRQSDTTIHACVISHRGCVRENNEDNFFFDGDFMTENTVDEGVKIQADLSRNFHLFAVCDGMGGLKGGERASAIGVRALGALNIYMPAGSVKAAVDFYAENASNQVYEDSMKIGESGREGTTLALLYLSNGKAHVGNVGDSRVYILRSGKLFQLSTDHSPVYQMMKRGELTREQMRKHPKGNVISAFIGMAKERRPEPYASYFSCEMCREDRFMICSDGVSDLLSHEEMQRILTEKKEPAAASETLIMRALEMGGKDNSTAMVIDVSGERLPPADAASMDKMPKER